MPKTRYYIPRFKVSSRALCNDAAAATWIFANEELTIDERGFTLIPYGFWRHAAGWQKFGKDQATAICNAFNSAVGQIKRALVGLPVFKGHPDQPEFRAEFPDDTPYGQVAELEARAEGLAIKMVLSNAGADLVRKGLKFISPRWDALPNGEKDDATVWEPYKLLSIGLVAKPNIPNASLVNHAANIMNKKDLIALFALAADATDEQVTAAVTAAAKRPTAESLSNAQTEATTAKGALAAANAKLTEANTKLSDTATALANEQKAHRTALVNAAFKEGRITEADVPAWTRRLETSFADESKALSNIAPVVKVRGITDSLAAVITEVNQRLQSMSPEQRDEWSKTGILANDDSTDGAGGGDDMSNVRKLCNLVDAEMKKPSYDGIKDPNARRSAAMRNVLTVHKHFTQMKATDAGS